MESLRRVPLRVLVGSGTGAAEKLARELEVRLYFFFLVLCVVLLEGGGCLEGEARQKGGEGGGECAWLWLD